MTELLLTQAEADQLFALEKHRVNDEHYDYNGGVLSIPLQSADKREQFILDIRRGRIDLQKGTYQSRSRQVTVLARLDFGGAPHRNPDDVEVPCPHLHLYREGFGDKWAAPIPIESFPRISDPWATLGDFMAFCNITQPPIINRGLFV